MAERWSEYPKVSIVGSTYNHERFVQRSLESALAQDYPNLEIVMVDDGSTDRTAELAERYADRVRFVRKEHGGLISTVNRFYREATGEFIAFCGGDDELVPGRVWTQLRYLREHPEVGMVYGDMEVIDARGDVLHPSWFGHLGLEPPSGLLLPRLFESNCIGAGGMMLRAAMRERFWPIPERVPYEDWWTSVHIAAVAEIHYVPEVVYRYRIHDKNLSIGPGAGGRARQALTEARFRLRLVTAPQLADRVGVETLLACQSKTDRLLAVAASELPGDPRGLVERDEVAAADAARRALAALETADRELALREAVRALGHDPWNPVARELFAAADGAPAPTPAPDAAGGSRVVVARGGELLERPALLARYSEAIGAAHDVTLVVLAADDEVAPLTRLAEDAGVTAPGAADVLVTTSLEEKDALAIAFAALGRSWPSLRSFEESSVERLSRELEAASPPVPAALA